MNDTTRARLLESARKLFGSNGFRGATVREITAAAHANLGAVTYHFGTKRALYIAVLEVLFDHLASLVEGAGRQDDAPIARIRAIVSALFRFFEGAPDAPALIVHQLSGGAAPPEAILVHVRRIVRAVEAVVGDGRERGTFRELNPILVAFSIISQSVWFALAGRSIAPVIFPGVDHGVLARRIEVHISDVISRALTVEAPPP